jgi:hypothetical protein
LVEGVNHRCDNDSAKKEQVMNAIKSVVRNRRIELEAPDELPEGTEVLVELIPLASQQIGIDESEWRDSPTSLTDWEEWIRTIEPLEFTPQEAERMADYEEQMRRYNIEAIRRQMAEGSGG